jgi:hypothetical protein
MKNVFAVIGMFGTVVLIVACGVAALWIGNILLDTNRAPAVLETAVSTIEAAPPADSTIRMVGVQDAPGVTEAVVVATVTAVPSPVATTPPTPTAVPTATPAPTRPAIEKLPTGEGPYTVEQMQICRDVWAQSLQAELTVHQFGYCQGVVER